MIITIVCAGTAEARSKEAFVVEVDASDVGVCVVLSQCMEMGGKMYPIAYFSRKLSPAKRNYKQNPETWSTYPAWAKYMQNSLCHAGTGLTPFECVHGYEPPLYPWNPPVSDQPVVELWCRRSEQIWVGESMDLGIEEQSSIKGLPRIGSEASGGGSPRRGGHFLRLTTPASGSGRKPGVQGEDPDGLQKERWVRTTVAGVISMGDESVYSEEVRWLMDCCKVNNIPLNVDKTK
ncbi:hypothetical protein P4O66_000659 [Electrophorus voltai]|uniref:Reverse transcriptase/retrotransposon-derived protein RNase H-like domain-containing protein n=1 Tax=Electrophorus voltai TaxID=2609070 RepID=A0AAD9DXZ5_9TELE|nr:hypothetical protein P4O66_000659 [Electrophorus voltai]